MPMKAEDLIAPMFVQNNILERIARLERQMAGTQRAPVVIRSLGNLTDNFSVAQSGSIEIPNVNYISENGHIASIKNPGIALANRLMLPATVGVWPMSIYNPSFQAYEIAQNRYMTAQGTPFVDGFGGFYLLPYARMTTGSDGFYRADETALSITGPLSFIAWVRFGGTASAIEIICNKGLNATQYSFRLLRQADGTLLGRISNNGTTWIDATGPVLDGLTWYHIAFTYFPSSYIRVFVDSVKYENTTSIPAAIYDGTAAFTLCMRETTAGSYTGYMENGGMISLISLHATAHAPMVIADDYEIGRLAYKGYDLGL